MESWDTSSENSTAPPEAAEPRSPQVPGFRVAMAGSISIGGAMEAAGSAAINVSRGALIVGVVLVILLIAFLALRPTLRAASASVVGATRVVPYFA